MCDPVCTLCGRKSEFVRTIGEIFTSVYRKQSLVSACSDACLLNLRKKSIEISKQVIEDLLPFMTAIYTSDQMHYGTYLMRITYPTRQNEQKLRFAAKRLLDGISIYDEVIPMSLISKVALYREC